MKKILSLVLAGLLMLACFTGCGSKTNSAEETASAVSEVEAPAEETPAAPAEQEVEEPEEPGSVVEEPAEPEEERPVIEYPIDNDVTISVWRAFESFMWNGLMDGYQDMPMLQNIMDMSGYNISFEAVNDASSTEAFNLMIAGGDYADLIGMDSYTGGVAKAYEDGLVYDLTDYLDEYMPDYAATLDWFEENYPTAYKKTISNDGSVLSVYSIYDEYAQEQGLVYRADWAEECGLSDIETLDDLNQYLDYVVSEYHPQYAITPSNGGVIDGITGAFGVTGFDASGSSVEVGLYLEGDTVVSSLTSDGFRDYLAWFAERYAEGAIYSDFYTDSYGPDWINSYFASDDVAISFLRSDKISSISSEAESASFTLLPTTSIVQSPGEAYTFGDEHTMAMSCFSIMSTTEHLEDCLYFLNWFFTDEGYIVSNFGEENVSFTYDENGEVRFTDLIMESEYSNKVQVRNMYTAMIFPYVKDVDAFFYTYSDVEQEAIEVWSQTSDESRLPTFELDGEASSEFATKASDIVAYAATVVMSWMTGAATLDDASWSEYVDTCNAMGLEDVVEIYQDGYDAFLRR